MGERRVRGRVFCRFVGVGESDESDRMLVQNVRAVVENAPD